MGGFYYDDFVSIDRSAAEQRWQQIERRLPAVYKAIRKGTALTDPSARDTIVDILAMHWARSPAMREVHQRAVQKVTRTFRRMLEEGNPQPLADRFRSATGRDPGGPQILAWMAENKIEMNHDDAEDLFANRNGGYFERAREHFAEMPLLLGRAASHNDLIIGDVPLLTPNEDWSKLGPHHGVGLEQVHTAIMPLGPGILIGAGSDIGEMELTADDVDRFNRLQIEAAQRWLGARVDGPGESLLQHVAELAARRQRPPILAQTRRSKE